MKVILLLEKIFEYVFFIYSVLYSFENRKKLFPSSGDKTNRTKLMSSGKKIKFILNCLMILLAVIVYFYLVLKFKIVSTISQLFTIFVYGNVVFKSFPFYFAIFLKPDVEKEYRFDIDSISFYLIILIHYSIILNWPKFLIQQINTISNAAISDLLLMVFVFIYYSILLSFIIVFVTAIDKILINTNLKEKITEFPQKIYKDVPQAKFRNKYSKRLNNSNFTWNLFFITIMYVVEILIDFILFVFYILRVLFSLICDFFIEIIIGIYKIIKIIASLTKEKDLSLCIRLSIILSLLLMVIENEYSTFLRVKESTNILEFLASTIIIPIIFDSISNLRKSQYHNNFKSN